MKMGKGGGGGGVEAPGKARGLMRGRSPRGALEGEFRGYDGKGNGGLRRPGGTRGCGRCCCSPTGESLFDVVVDGGAGGREARAHDVGARQHKLYCADVRTELWHHVGVTDGGQGGKGGFQSVNDGMGRIGCCSAAEWMMRGIEAQRVSGACTVLLVVL